MDNSFWEKWKADMISWDHHINSVRNHDILTEEQKDFIINGFQKLQEVTDKEWLRNIVEKKHPLMNQFANPVLWSWCTIADFGYSLSKIKEIKNFDILFQKLNNINDYHTAKAELWTASSLKNCNIEIEIIRPIQGGNKSADILARINDIDIFCEVTSLTSSKHAIEAHRTYNDLAIPFIYYENDVKIDGVICKELESSRVSSLKELIKKNIEKAKKEDKQIELIESEELKLLITPKGRYDNERKNWLQKNKFDTGIRGPPIIIDEPRRIKRRISDKVKQIPDNKPGILVIYDEQLFTDSDGLLKIMKDIESEVCKHKRLIGIILVMSFIDGFKLQTNESVCDFSIVSKSLCEGFSRNYVILKNKQTTFTEFMELLDALQ